MESYELPLGLGMALLQNPSAMEQFSKLNEQERQILMLHAVTGLKHREIAEIMGIPLATVLSKYARSLKKLKHILQETEV